MRTEKQNNILKELGNHCRTYRKQEMGMTLKQFSKECGYNLKTLSNFENGRSSNTLLLMSYIQHIEDNGARLGFVQGVNVILDKED